MKIKVLAILMVLGTQLFGQRMNPILPYVSTDYPSTDFSTKTNTYHLGKVQILIIMVHPRNNASSIFQCRSWLMIKKNMELLDQRYYNIEPVGGCTGLFVPAKQPCKNYFILSKFGDYNGQTIIIDSSGSLVSIAGGSFSISPNGRYLFTTFDSDVSGISIYDLKNKESIYSEEGKSDLRYNNFYIFKNQYYVSMDGGTESQQSSISFIDVKNKKVTQIKTPVSFLKSANKLKEYNKVQTLPGCHCGV